MKICVTGATGFIGAALTKKLVQDGHQVHALVRSVRKAEPLKHKNIHFFKGSILNKNDVFNAMHGCTHVFHLAALAKVWTKNPDTYYHINVDGTKNVLEAAIACTVNRIVVCSTAGVYGASFNGTINEDSIRQCDFFNEYESSKALSESIVKNYILQKNLDAVIISPTRVYGPYIIGEPESVTYMIKKYLARDWRVIPGKGDKVGNYVYVNDVVAGLVNAMKMGKKGHSYLLAGTNHNLLEFFETLKNVSDTKVKMYHIPIWLIMAFAHLQLFLAKMFDITPIFTPKWAAKTKYHWEVSSKKSELELGLRITPLEEGLKKTINWLQTKNVELKTKLSCY